MNNKVEFGDFQTPPELCDQVCGLLKGMKVDPNSIIEPTCGKGAFLRSSIASFPSCRNIHGFEINPQYLKEASEVGAIVHCSDFFSTDWMNVISDLPDPLLVIGNPPWVTNSVVGAMNGMNLPEKTNFLRMNGMDAITGKSNFDISEWMISHLIGILSGRHATVSMLCKTTVARKVLANAWKQNLEIRDTSIWKIDAGKNFGAAVDACLLVCHLGPKKSNHECSVYSCLSSSNPDSSFRLQNGRLVTNCANNYEYLHGSSRIRWRSGVKHDCSKVMELKPDKDGFQNGLGEIVELENDYLFPMLKSSDLTKPDPAPKKLMLVTQRHVGEDTSPISWKAPLTWRYLQNIPAI